MKSNLTLVILFILPALCTPVKVALVLIYIKREMLRLYVNLGYGLITASAVIPIGEFWGIRQLLAWFAFQLIVALTAVAFLRRRKYRQPSADGQLTG